MKHAQISVFILAGLILLVAVGVFVMMQKEYQAVPQSSEQTAVQAYVQSCFEPVVSDAFFIAGFQGGYIQIDDTIDNPARQHYYYYYYQDISPNLTAIYQNMEWYILNHTIDCIQNNNLPYAISFDNNLTSLDFIAFNTETTVTLNLPITITQEDTISTLDTFTAVVPVSLEKMYDISRQVVETIAISDPLTCMSCIHNIATTNNVFINILDYEEISDYYIIVDTSVMLYNAPYVFSFIVRTKDVFDTSLYFDEKSPLQLNLSAYSAQVGKEFFLNINTQEFLQSILPQFAGDPDYNLTFSDITPLFEINPILGTINFTPTKNQKGNHNALIKIKDSTGNTEYVTLNLVIT